MILSLKVGDEEIPTKRKTFPTQSFMLLKKAKQEICGKIGKMKGKSRKI